MRENTEIPAHRSFHLGFNHYTKSGAYQSIFLHAPSTHGLHPLQFYTRPQRGLRVTVCSSRSLKESGAGGSEEQLPPLPPSPHPAGHGIPSAPPTSSPGTAVPRPLEAAKPSKLQVLRAEFTGNNSLSATASTKTAAANSHWPDRSQNTPRAAFQANPNYSVVC